MKNCIELTEILNDGINITYQYDVSGDWIQYFNIKKDYTISYPTNISSVPDSVLVVPFVSNFLPMVWLFDAEMKLKEIDSDFYDQLEKVKSGYKNMFPMLDFKGKVVAESILKNTVEVQDKTAVFFSGGVDAYTTLFRHIEEKPYLITIWGADIRTDNETGWKNVENHIREVADKYKLQCLVIKSEFRMVIHEEMLSQFVKESGDGWWHGFQHGVALISHIAPLAYCFGIKTDYIASSYPEYMKGQYTCASDPTIDNYMYFCGCNTIHDGYELDRQEKVRYIIKKSQQGYPSKLRVCWQSDGGENCCECEKCYRTILEIVSEKGNPSEYGFDWNEASIKKCRKKMLNKITMQNFDIKQYFYPIRENLLKNRDNIADYEKYMWFTERDFNKFNDYPMKKIRKSFLGRVLRKFRILQ